MFSYITMSINMKYEKMVTAMILGQNKKPQIFRLEAFDLSGSPKRTKLEPLDDRFTNLCCYLIAIRVQLKEL